MEWDDGQWRVWRGRAAAIARAVVPTGFAELDRHLPGGGWPVGALTEVFVAAYGSGELALLLPALITLTRSPAAQQPQWVAWIAPPFVPYAPALQQHGVDVARLLVIHPTADCKSRLWAVEQVLRSGASAGVLAWVTAADEVILRRLQLAAEDRACLTWLFRPASARRQRSPAALRIGLSRGASAARIDIIKCRGGRPGVVDIVGLGGSGADIAAGAARQ